MGRKNQQNKQIEQKQSTKKGSNKKERGNYEARLNLEQRYQVIFLLVNKMMSLSQAAKYFNRNKETIRSIFKNRLNLSLFWNLENCLIQNYLNQSNEVILDNEAAIKKQIKNIIDSRQQGDELDQIINNLNDKRQVSKYKKSDRKIEFNSKNRRIIKKIAKLIPIVAGQTAAINNTATQKVTVYGEFAQVEFEDYESSQNFLSFESSTQMNLWGRGHHRQESE